MRSKQLTRILTWIFILYTLHLTLYTSTAFCASKGNHPVTKHVIARSEATKQSLRLLRSLRSLAMTMNNWLCPNVYAASKGNPPVAHWRFDESGGPTAYDDTANNNDGALNAGAGGTNTTVGQMWYPQGKISGAVEFDGTDDYAGIAHTNLLNIGNNFTISAWFKQSSLLQGSIIDTRDVDYNVRTKGYALYIRTVDQYGLKANSVGLTLGKNSWGWQVWSSETNSVSAGVWQHVAVTVADANTASKTVKFYINGKESTAYYWDQSGQAAVYWGDYANANRIGSYYPATYPAYGGGYFTGLIDDVKIYNYARTADQILVDYNAGVAVHLGAGTDPNEGNPPIAYYSFDENTGQTVYDRSGSSNNGTLGSTSGSDANDPIWSAGKYGSALKFDGTNDMAEVLDTNNTLDLTTAGTIECWAYINNNYRFWVAAKCASASNPLSNYYFGTGSGNKWLGGIGNGTTQQDCADPNVAPTFTWTHAVFTFDGTKLKLYINGIKVNEVNQTITPLANNDHLSIGCWGTVTSYPANGYIDEIKIYNYARTQAQIAYDYNKGKPVAQYRFEEGGGAISHNDYSSADSGTAPVGWWRFDAGTGTSCVDSSGNSLTATASAASWTTGKIGPYGLNNTSATVIDNSLLEGMSSLTISAWVYPTVLEGTDRRIVEKGLWENADMSYRLMYQTDWGSGTGYPNGYWNFHIKTSTGNYNANGPNGVSANRKNMWHHIVGVLDGSAGKVRIYDNGILIGESTASGTINTNSYNALIWSAAVGIVDDVRIYNYARTAEQIYNDYKTTHGTLVGDTKFSDGKMGKALQFDGSGDYVEAPDQTSLNPDSQITVAAWIKPSAGDYRTIVSKGYSSSDGGYAFRITRDSEPIRLFFQVYNTSGTIGSAGVYSNIANGNWYYVVGTYDGSYVRIYINGVLNDSGALTGSIKSNTLPVRFGRLSTSAGATEYYPGLIDDVRIYNYARAANQILQDYNAGVTTRLGGQSAGEADPWGGAMPVGYWKLDENTGVKAYDASGNGNDGALTNGPTWAQGKNGPALSFDGTNDYVNCGTSATLNPSQFTVEAWVKYNEAAGYDGIVQLGSSGSTANPAVYLAHYGEGGPHKELIEFYNGTSWQIAEKYLTTPTGEWRHLAGTYNGSNLKLYVNGILVDDENIGSQSISYDTGGSTKIGTSQWGGGHYSNASIDDVRIYNYARTQAQIAWDYNQGKPVGHWRFEEGSEATVYDDSDNNNDGTITIGATGTQTTVASAWTNGATGKFGKCMSFDGTDDYVSLGNSPTLNFTNNGTFSISVWVKPNTLTSAWRRGIISQEAYLTSGYRFGFANGGAPIFWTSQSGGTLSVSGGTLAVDQWNHIEVTYDNQQAYIYLNGAQTGSATGTYVAGTNILRLGYFINEYFSGLIDDVRVYNYARTAEQIRQDYNQGLAARLGE